MMTPYQAKYFAHELSRLGGQGVDRLGRALFDACVDLNPHQIEAALFALRSPLAQGALLADEVGLGKTIEAGLVLCQYWAEQRRNLLVICPASLRKQWEIELREKFNLPALVLDASTYREQLKQDIANPFQNSKIIICSIHFAAGKAEEVKQIPWDLVIIDEAHKLRNVYRESNRLGQRIRWATEERKKLLLTATPLQNSLLELYGLATLIDPRLFGDLASFRTQYLNYGGDPSGLRERLSRFCWRTLRSQVVEFVRYTERKLITRPFQPTAQEQQLYEAISDYLQREDTYALPAGQRHLLILLVRKVLASSPNAVAGTLEMMRQRLEKLKVEALKSATVTDLLLADIELEADLLDEILADEEDSLVQQDVDTVNPGPAPVTPLDIPKLDAEIQELSDYIRWARSIGVDTKAKALLTALKIGFSSLAEMGAAEKVVIFTESRRTQAWLQDYLEANGYVGQVLTFNGSNQDDRSGQIYQTWLAKNQDTGRISGSKAVDLRAAIIDQFRDAAKILIATEAGAEGLNLQFCSAIINYDLPWNPQRIEQRIGRCHRYGQNYDVVVINFLNERNDADRRVYELLEHKFNLFSGVFGASDEVLGAIEAGVDFERRVLEIYQACRSQTEIETAFTQLKAELDEQIQARLQATHQLLLENFDQDVHDRLKVNLAGTQAQLDRMGRMFWLVTQQILKHQAQFNVEQLTFQLATSPFAQAPRGEYHLISKTKENIPGEFLYRLSHPLGEYVIEQAKAQDCPVGWVIFNSSGHQTRIAVVEKLQGKQGWLSLQQVQIHSFQAQDYLLFSAFSDDGQTLDQETCEKLLSCAGECAGAVELPPEIVERLEQEQAQYCRATLARNLEENNRHFAEVREQLDKWADDLELAAQKELDDIKRKIRELQRQSRQAPTLEEQHRIQAEIKKQETKKRKARKQMFDLEDEIAAKRDRLVESLENRLQQRTTVTPLFTIRWQVI